MPVLRQISRLRVLVKMAFIIHPKGLEPGPKLDHLLERVRFCILHKHDVIIQHAEERIVGMAADIFFVDEVSRGK